MKKILLLSFILLNLLNSCSSDNSETVKPIASFTLSATIVNIGDEIKVTNTATAGAEIVSYTFNFGNDITSTEKEPTFYYSKPGQYSVSLVVKDANGLSTTNTIGVTVNNLYSFPTQNPITTNNDTDVFPIEIGVYENKIFYTEGYRTILTSSPQLYRHVAYDETTKTFTTKMVAQKMANSGHSHTTFLNNGNKIVTMVESLNYIGGREVELNSNWEFIKFGNSGQITYGSIQNNNQYYFYGSYAENPSIEIRNNAGQIISRKTYENTLKNAFIGHLIKTGNTYVAFGGKYAPSTTDAFMNYKPLILFLNENLEITNQKIYETGSLNTSLKEWNNLNGFYKVINLTNGNLALYSHNELRITSPQGEELKLIRFNGSGNIQGLIEVDNGFIVSSARKIEKYDNLGNLTKSISSEGTNHSDFVKKGNVIYFAIARPDLYQNYSLYKVRLGAIDSNLTYHKL
ncbi:PKD domain-containing protein [Flavobacterium lipolyticum]|uniref:PKD domain-containing protein n=1 Tax=Flavobacterium lipolyticum TaxID=2893754 RepID=A0ABS8LZP0_9FLAO|nr:PKD domain-containing protein [Flavobacterium sp. F-126]MCC9018052.1 PKD domain-containing protein [Flavobacterium sp. F-126]